MKITQKIFLLLICAMSTSVTYVMDNGGNTSALTSTESGTNSTNTFNTLSHPTSQIRTISRAEYFQLQTELFKNTRME